MFGFMFIISTHMRLCLCVYTLCVDMFYRFHVPAGHNFEPIKVICLIFRFWLNSNFAFMTAPPPLLRIAKFFCTPQATDILDTVYRL